jgi:hypothetical protein
MSLFNAFANACRPTDEKINAMLHYHTYAFKKETVIGVYLVSTEHLKINAPDEKTAIEMAGPDYTLVGEIKND